MFPLCGVLISGKNSPGDNGMFMGDIKPYKCWWENVVLMWALLICQRPEWNADLVLGNMPMGWPGFHPGEALMMIISSPGATTNPETLIGKEAELLSSELHTAFIMSRKHIDSGRLLPYYSWTLSWHYSICLTFKTNLWMGWGICGNGNPPPGEATWRKQSVRVSMLILFCLDILELYDIQYLFWLFLVYAIVGKAGIVTSIVPNPWCVIIITWGRHSYIVAQAGGGTCIWWEAAGVIALQLIALIVSVSEPVCELLAQAPLQGLLFLTLPIDDMCVSLYGGRTHIWLSSHYISTGGKNTPILISWKSDECFPNIVWPELKPAIYYYRNSFRSGDGRLTEASPKLPEMLSIVFSPEASVTWHDSIPTDLPGIVCPNSERHFTCGTLCQPDGLVKWWRNRAWLFPCVTYWPWAFPKWAGIVCTCNI